MTGFISFVGGIFVGVWATLQSKALHITPPNLPVIHHIDPVAVLLVVAVGMVMFLMRGKRNGGKS